MKTEHGATLDDGSAVDRPDALDRLIAEVRVPVRPDFSLQVMSRLALERAPHRRSVSREWWAVASIAAVLVALSAVVLLAGSGSESGIASSLVDLVVATLSAGAGLLAASWRGLGQTVGAALDGSVTAIAALGLAALAANGLLVLLLRRRRAAARMRDD